MNIKEARDKLAAAFPPGMMISVWETAETHRDRTPCNYSEFLVLMQMVDDEEGVIIDRADRDLDALVAAVIAEHGEAKP